MLECRGGVELNPFVHRLRDDKEAEACQPKVVQKVEGVEVPKELPGSLQPLRQEDKI